MTEATQEEQKIIVPQSAKDPVPDKLKGPIPLTITTLSYEVFYDGPDKPAPARIYERCCLGHQTLPDAMARYFVKVEVTKPVPKDLISLQVDVAKMNGQQQANIVQAVPLSRNVNLSDDLEEAIRVLPRRCAEAGREQEKELDEYLAKMKLELNTALARMMAQQTQAQQNAMAPRPGDRNSKRRRRVH